MRIAKDFRWEMGHRLPFHEGQCVNLHGHSYKMMVEFEGDLDDKGMVLDYYVVKEVIQPLVDELDHTFMVKDDDRLLIDLLKQMNSKHVVVNFHSTAENMVYYFLDKIKSANLPKNLRGIKVKIFETETTYAEDQITLE
ncbi:MAG: 6-carboxytetrahydropterin synthase [Ignavibacteriae bacterium HGW-Ignavibacteriae-2]|nr:MAG: 6-carboxytetrahydropterin synthase [Ignavibacteriae bacterium HGW-Ignavibacteriae-2]